MSQQWSTTTGYFNLTNGISQQPPRVRQDSQCDDALNVYPTVFHQMGPRPPLEVVSLLYGLKEFLAEINVYPFHHAYTRDDTESYEVVLDGSGHLKVWSRDDGTEKTVTLDLDDVNIAAATDINAGTGVITVTNHGLNTGDSVRWLTHTGTLPTQTTGAITGEKFVRETSANTFKLYPTLLDAIGDTNVITYTSVGTGTVIVTRDQYLFNSAPETGFTARTLKDTTFVINRSVTPAMLDTVSPVRISEGLVAIRDWVSGATYNVQATFTGGLVNVNPTGTTVNTVATDLVAKLIAHANWPVGATATAMGNVVHIQHASLTKLSGSDNRAGTAIRVFKDTVIKTGDLTPFGPHGYLVKVTGSSTTASAQDANTADDQYYKFVADDGTSGSGRWVETVAPGIAYQLNPVLMPHTLTRNADGTFTFTTITWGERTVGDTDTNPNPPFIGQTIRSLFLLAGRLGFICGNQFVCSRVGEDSYFEFFRSTTSAALDNDPVYGIVPSEEVNLIHSAIAWNGELILFGDKCDGVVNYGSKFTLSNLNISTPTRSGISSLCPPFLSGSNLLFIVEGGEWSNIGSYEIDQLTSVRSAESITDGYLSRLIPKNVKRMVGREKDFVAIFSTETRAKLYVMTYAKKSQKLIQQGVVGWDFSTVPEMDILNVSMGDAHLYLTYKGPEQEYYVGRLDTSVGAADAGWPKKCYLDHRITAEGEFTEATNTTAFTAPFAIPDSIYRRAVIATVVEGEERWAVGESLTLTPASTSSSLVVSGDAELSTIYAGYAYDKYFVPNPIFVKDPNSKAVDMFEETNLGRIAVGFFNTQYLKAELISKVSGKVYSSREFEGGLRLDNIEAILDDNETTFTGVMLLSGENAPGDSILRISSDSHLPFFCDTLQFTLTRYTGKK